MRKDGAEACALPRAGCPRTWLTCSPEPLSMKRMERVGAAVKSCELLRHPAVGDESSVGYDLCMGLILARQEPTRKSPVPDPLCRPLLQVPVHPR